MERGRCRHRRCCGDPCRLCERLVESWRWDVICGAKEEKDEHGFPRVVIVGLSAARLKEVEGKVLTACRDRVSPSIAPLVDELPSNSPDRRVLVFIMPATRSAHLFRRRESARRYYVRISRETREARNVSCENSWFGRGR